MTDRAWYEDVPVPLLMREARDVYRDAVRQALAHAGFDDIPRSGSALLAGLDRHPAESSFSPQGKVVASLGLSKQAASQLIDTLVLRDYLERRIDPEDRRRMEVRLTERGRTAARAIREAVDAIEAALVRRIGFEQLRELRAGLAAFSKLREGAGAE